MIITWFDNFLLFFRSQLQIYQIAAAAVINYSYNTTGSNGTQSNGTFSIDSVKFTANYTPNNLMTFGLNIDYNSVCNATASKGWTLIGTMKLKLSSANSTANCTGTNCTSTVNGTSTGNSTSGGNSTATNATSLDNTPFTIVGGYYPCARVDTTDKEWVLQIASTYPIPIYGVTIYKYVFRKKSPTILILYSITGFLYGNKVTAYSNSSDGSAVSSANTTTNWTGAITGKINVCTSTILRALLTYF